MIKELHIIVPGLPQGKGAARHTVRGFTYTPTKTRQYMNFVKECAIKAGAQPLEDPCSMTIYAFFPIPDSYTKSKTLACLDKLYFYTKKPDTDNISKIKDALKDVAFKDDAQVFAETVMKEYDPNPRLEIVITYHEQWKRRGKEALRSAD